MNYIKSCFKASCIMVFILLNTTADANGKENTAQQYKLPRARGAKKEKPTPDWTLQHQHFALDLLEIYKINKNNLTFLADKIKKSGIDVNIKNPAGLTLRDLAMKTDLKYGKTFQMPASKKFPTEWKALMEALTKNVECKKVLGENNGNKANMH